MMLKIILYLVLSYLFLVAFLYLAQRHYIYFPRPGNIEPASWGLPEVQLIQLTTTDGLKLNSWYYPAKNDHTPTLVYFHGNFGHIGHRAVIIKPYIQAGYGMLLLGYRGYSGNRGSPSENGLYIDARTAIDFLKNQGVQPQCMVLLGVSLGTGIAIQMATEFPVGAVILQSSFTSMVDVAKQHYHWLPIQSLLRDRYQSIDKIQLVQAPLLFIHGEQDGIVPVKLGRRLYTAAPWPKQMKIYSNAGHNNLPDASPVVVRFLLQHQICSQ